MHLGMEISLGQMQKLALTPQMEQSLQFLQMGAEELNQCIEEEVLSNPMLEYGKRKIQGAGSQSFENYLADEKSSGMGLKEYLRLQLYTKGLSHREQKKAEYFIECLEESGYLKMDAGELGRGIGISKQEAEEEIHFLQGLEPRGVFARDLRECLLLQLTDSGGTTVRMLVERYLEAIAGNRIPKISRETGLSVEEIAEGIRYIKKELEPVPGRGYGSGEKDSYIYPDVTVKKESGSYRVILNREKVYPLELSQDYVPLLSQAQGDDRAYLKEQYQKAKSFLKNIGKREETLLALSKALVVFQEEFFEKGKACLKPMNLMDIAQEMNIHESTVSRAVKDKYLECRWGVFEMRYFFSNKTSDGSDCNVKEKVREIIDGEDKRKPLSDAGIAKILTEHGICISRRTVAKYREQLSIPAAQGRKIFS